MVFYANKLEVGTIPTKSVFQYTINEELLEVVVKSNSSGIITSIDVINSDGTYIYDSNKYDEILFTNQDSVNQCTTHLNYYFTSSHGSCDLDKDSFIQEFTMLGYWL
jgi:hypothetical protein